jgi:hypothetical protein
MNNIKNKLINKYACVQLVMINQNNSFLYYTEFPVIIKSELFTTLFPILSCFPSLEECFSSPYHFTVHTLLASFNYSKAIIRILLDCVLCLSSASLETTGKRGVVRKCIRTDRKDCNTRHHNVTERNKQQHICNKY